MKIMAFIPARGGSKGIPRKNLVPLAGKPLIQYTIEAVRQSRRQLEIFISSDDPEIIDFCRSLGVDVPYQRPAKLAADETPMVDAVIHALDWLQEKNRSLPQAILLLQPTSPLRNAQDIDQAIDFFITAGADSLISVHPMLEHPYECLEKVGDGWRLLARPAQAVKRRQEYDDKYYFINGAIYLARTEFLLQKRIFVEEGSSLLYVMDPARGVDIDTFHDFQRAEFFLGQVAGQ